MQHRCSPLLPLPLLHFAFRGIEQRLSFRII
jgi:hypothetical protein